MAFSTNHNDTPRSFAVRERRIVYVLDYTSRCVSNKVFKAYIGNRMNIYNQFFREPCPMVMEALIHRFSSRLVQYKSPTLMAGAFQSLVKDMLEFEN